LVVLRAERKGVRRAARLGLTAEQTAAQKASKTAVP